MIYYKEIIVGGVELSDWLHFRPSHENWLGSDSSQIIGILNFPDTINCHCQKINQHTHI